VSAQQQQHHLRNHRSLEQVESNLKAAGVKLDTNVIAKIKTVFARLIETNPSKTQVPVNRTV